MRYPDVRGHFGPIALCAAVVLGTAVGCGGGGGGGTGARGGSGATGGTGATGARGGGCPVSSARGTLAIEISGTPSHNGMVVVGPTATGTEVTTSSDLPLSAGPQSVTAYLAAAPPPCVRAGEVTTVHVTYSLIDTSGVVWTGLSNGPTPSSLLGFDPA